MKTKFATIDLCAVIHDLKELIGMRVVKVYDINSKTYLIKLQKPNDKAFILFESGIRIHRTTYEWPKAIMPSQFSMKFRKHINQKRLTSVAQVGVDRIIDLQFGSEDRSCHVIVELYDRGNVVLTDQDYTILNILRQRTDASDHDVRFAVREKYPLEHARQESFTPSVDNIRLFLGNSKSGELLRKALVKNTPHSSLLLDHCLLSVGISLTSKIGSDVGTDEDTVQRVLCAMKLAESISKEIAEKSCRGYIAYSVTQKEGGPALEAYQEYYPYDFVQFHVEQGSSLQVLELETFSEAIDKFYSSLDSQKAEQKVQNVEKEAGKRVDNIKKDHQLRLKGLEELQVIQERRAEYIRYNRELVEDALLLVRTALADKRTWDEVRQWLIRLGSDGVEAARSVVKLDLKSNCISLRLTNPYEEDAEPMNVEIDVGMSAEQNARRYFSDRKSAAVKQHKTIQAGGRALKSAQLQAKNKIDQVQTKQNFIRTRRIFWFEKFHWFESSDGYLVVAGRDSQQNDMLVRRYLRPGDVYVHAEIQGAASVVIRNRGGPHDEIPPRTLNEAGTIALCLSSAWEAKVVVYAWWVRHDQVSRTAPSGEYLPSGSFMIRGKKNFLPMCQLALGFGLMFKLDDESIERHREMKRQLDEKASMAGDPSAIRDVEGEAIDDEEVPLDSTDTTESEDEADAASANGGEFPDVEVKLGSLRLSHINSGDQEVSVITLAPLAGKAKKTETDKYLENRHAEEHQKKQEKQGPAGNRPMSKREKHKKEKIRRKYKDQDDDERKIRLEALGHFKGEQTAIQSGDAKSSEEPPKPTVETEESSSKDAKPAEEEEAAADDDEVEDIVPENFPDEAALLDSITSAPLSEDTLLFALPMCGPYSAMQRFKFKVKVTPGTGKRGKAVKSALALFMHDKTLTAAERLLIKNLASDDHVAQTMPGKVRISAPFLLNAVKRKA